MIIDGMETVQVVVHGVKYLSGGVSSRSLSLGLVANCAYVLLARGFPADVAVFTGDRCLTNNSLV